jgi:Mrp family chromosome partitioning ATPase
MENIRQAVERAKRRLPQQAERIPLQPSPGGSPSQQIEHVQLDPSYLQSHRIVAYDGKDPRSRPFDILRTEVLRSMDLKGWKTLAVTSPTPSCGKTVTAINLALSMARQPQRDVCLIDLDLLKPQIGTCLGLQRREGVLGVIEGREDIRDVIVKAQVGTSKLEVLPTAPSSSASDLIGSIATKMMLRDILEGAPSRVAIIDLPPLLTGHDVISILPFVDCVLFVAAVGTTKIAEIEECNKYLQSADVVRFVLNKAPESSARYLYY